MYLVLSTFTSSPIPLIATTKCCVIPFHTVRLYRWVASLSHPVLHRTVRSPVLFTQLKLDNLFITFDLKFTPVFCFYLISLSCVIKRVAVRCPPFNAEQYQHAVGAASFLSARPPSFVLCQYIIADRQINPTASSDEFESSYVCRLIH
jgi:hypothetical protein